MLMKTRRRKYQNRFPDAIYKEKQKKVLAPPSVWTLRDKLSVIGGLALAVLVFFFPQFVSTFKHRKEIADRVDLWDREFALTASQKETLRKMEFQVHGAWLPKNKPVTSEASPAHREDIARTMGADAGARFLANKTYTSH